MKESTVEDREGEEVGAAKPERELGTAENAPDVVIEIEADGRVVFASPSCLATLGCPPEGLIGRKIDETCLAANTHERDRDAALRNFRHRAEPGLQDDHASSLPYRYEHPDGSQRWLESRALSYRNEDRASTIVLTCDVTERERALFELRQSEARYRTVARASRDVVTETDSMVRLTYINETCQEVLGYAPDELIGTSPVDLLHQDDREHFLGALRSGLRSTDPVHLERHRLRHRDGSWVWMEATGVMYRRSDGDLRTIGVARDVTERVLAEESRRELERRMQEAQKLEGLGVLAGGIAHDFNNLLTPILGEASLALLDLPGESPIRRRLQNIQKAVRHAAGLTHQMLSYAGRDTPHFERLDISRAVGEIAQLLKTAASREVVLEYELGRGLPLIQADPAQISQVFMNLISNASESVAGQGGTVVVRTGTVLADRAMLADAQQGEELPEGQYVYFDVQDDGCGMDAQVMGRIFEPFYTTKFTGRGLGLAAVLGIARGHNAAIVIDSTPGEGTRFRVLFPAGEDDPSPSDSLPEPGEEWRLRGTVLVVDDEEAVRELAAETLERAGLTVLVAEGGDEAIEIFRSRAADIAAVLLDRTMPGTSGESAFAEIRRIRPDAKVILVSGYSQDGTAERLGEQGLAGFLEKPFLPDELIDRIRKVIG